MAWEEAAARVLDSGACSARRTPVPQHFICCLPLDQYEPFEIRPSVPKGVRNLQTYLNSWPEGHRRP